MKFRVLPFVNAIGCLVLTGVLLVQWTRERSLDKTVATLRSDLRTAGKKAAAEAERSSGLERDIATLKEAIEATQKAADESRKAAEDSARLLAEKEAQSNVVQADVAAARDQVKVWQDAIAERDAKLRELNSDLTATRSRLDAAIAKLKAAGAQ